MKVYVGGRMSDPSSLNRVRKCQDRVEAAGMELALDWTKLVDNGPDEDLNPLQSRIIADAELSALRESDLVIIFHENSLGASIEMGIALERGLPLWVIHCAGGRQSIWFHLPNVVEFSELSFYAYCKAGLLSRVEERYREVASGVPLLPVG